MGGVLPPSLLCHLKVPHWDRPAGFSSDSKPLPPANRVRYILCLGQPCALGKAERQPQEAKCDWSKPIMMVLFALLLSGLGTSLWCSSDSWDLRAFLLGGRVSEIVLQGNGSSLRKRHRDPKRGVSPFSLYLFVYWFAFGHSWQCTMSTYCSYFAIVKELTTWEQNWHENICWSTELTNPGTILPSDFLLGKATKIYCSSHYKLYVYIFYS